MPGGGVEQTVAGAVGRLRVGDELGDLGAHLEGLAPGDGGIELCHLARLPGVPGAVHLLEPGIHGIR